MGLDTGEQRDLLVIYPELDQSYLGKQGQYHRCGRCGCRAFVPWHLLALRFLEGALTGTVTDAAIQMHGGAGVAGPAGAVSVAPGQAQ